MNGSSGETRGVNGEDLIIRLLVCRKNSVNASPFHVEAGEKQEDAVSWSPVNKVSEGDTRSCAKCYRQAKEGKN